jgi:hypothetical protein
VVRGIAATVLVFEAMVIFFATLVALDLSDVDDATVWSVGGCTAGAFVLLAGLLGRRGSYQVGSALQVLVVVAGIFVPAMFFLGVVFAGLWFFALHLGRRVERLKAARAEADPPG